ncbi:hypothetical protein KJY73_11155 [Bowmanella sp. Y26]|uniref:Kelch repeat-containing protein n=1 Tax=Bowmanella yangjiangensis TaxID=2811230 RepID=UPI001BDC4C9D|nr:hypothetical protein [Bowmanella yangjiangensis]MBT1064136.1 hypothetical protein [Bowmanella yangjiangensis]
MLTRRDFLVAGTAAVAANCIPGLSLAASRNWRALASLPVPLQEIYPCIFKDKIVIAGALEQVQEGKGLLGNMSPSKSVHLYDFKDNSWYKGPELPEPRHHLGLASDEHSLFAIGGFSSDKQDAWKMESQVWQLSSFAESWQPITSLPVPQAEAGYAFLGKDLHVVGGRTHIKGQLNDTSAHHFYDGASWQPAAPLPVARNSFSCVAHNNGLIVVGGRIYQKQHENQARVDFYEKQTDRWFELAPLPKASAGTAAAVWQNELYLFGGEAYYFSQQDKQWTLTSSETYNQIWQYSFAKDEWHTLPVAMSSTRHGLGAVSTQYGIYLLGGARQAGIEGVSNLVEKFTYLG